MLAKGGARYFFTTSQGQDVNLFWLAPGDIFGGASLLPQSSEFIVSTEATKESTILVWQRAAIRALTSQFPRLLENGLSTACDYLVWYLATHLSLVFDSARERLAHVLYSLSHGIGQRCTEGIRLEITNEQLANTANLTPFTVSRLLSEWQRKGAILKSHGAILLCRPEQLFGQKSSPGIQKLRVSVR
jgi:CRP-like cAMP-binding protein